MKIKDQEKIMLAVQLYITALDNTRYCTVPSCVLQLGLRDALMTHESNMIFTFNELDSARRL